ncbi:LIM/homeobox protein Lhx6-like isoform X2 [Varroa destructor]|uniref:LIM zinc-binding domain-containing protein n=1 Tax=Varroa destructor TaxID=109461 RepID=A0A7M7K1C6_VARDE|nr:LIM/homeobox protein Lhx6-like isoform X2 [Varroa destructor]
MAARRNISTDIFIYESLPRINAKGCGGGAGASNRKMKSGRRSQNSVGASTMGSASANSMVGVGSGSSVHHGTADGTTMSSALNSNNVSNGQQHPHGGAPECAGCQKPIRERYLLRALEQLWHEDCLKCACCDCRLGEVGSTLYTKANLILCKRDYLRLFGVTGLCSACHKTIPAFEMVMKARGNVYHLECFACQQCNHRFCVGDRFYLHENRILCEYDYEERMVFSQMGAYGGLQGGPPMQPVGHMQSPGHPGHPSGHAGAPYGPLMNGGLHQGAVHQGSHHGHSGAPLMPLAPTNQPGLERSSLVSPMQQNNTHNGANTTNSANSHKRPLQQSPMNGNVQQQQQQSPIQAGTPGAPSQPEPDILFDVGVSPAAPNSAQPPTQNNGPNGGSK